MDTINFEVVIALMLGAAALGTLIGLRVQLDRAKGKLARIKERSERVLDGGDWWLPGSELESPGYEAMELSVLTEEKAARWLLKVIDSEG